MQTSLDLLTEIESESNQTTQLNSNAFSDCANGFKAANNHFRNSKVIIINYQTEYDYDGLHRHLKLVQGFPDEKKALEYFDDYADLAIKKLVLDMRAENSENWYATDIGPSYRDETSANTEHSRRIAIRFAKVTNGNGFDWFDCEIAAITVEPRNPVGKALFSQISNAHVWNYYLSNFKGSEL